MGNFTLEIEETNMSKTEFITKAAECDHNFLWICQHPDQKGEKCTKICEKYHNCYEK